MNAEQELIKLSNYCAQHENWIDVRWVGKVLDGIRTMCASDAAAEKLLRDAINQQLAQLRDWANDAERRCKAETARADQLADWKESAMNVMNQINLQAIGEELGLPLGSEISSAILPAIKQLKAAEERADRAERALRECYVAIEGTVLGTSWELAPELREELSKAGNLARAALSPIPTPAK